MESDITPMSVNAAHLHNLETGRKKPNIELVVKLCKLCNVSADELIMDERDLEEMGGCH